MITFGELAEGFESDEYLSLDELLSPYEIMGIDRNVAWTYGRISKDLRSRGMQIGDNDLWIAATALANGYKVKWGIRLAPPESVYHPYP